MLPTNYKRAWLGKVYRNRGTQTLQEAIEAAADAAVESTETGQQVIGVSGNGQSTTFAAPTVFSGTPAFGEMAALAQEMLDRLTKASEYLVANGTASPTDAQLYEEMLEHLNPVISCGLDFTSLGAFERAR